MRARRMVGGGTLEISSVVIFFCFSPCIEGGLMDVMMGCGTSRDCCAHTSIVSFFPIYLNLFVDTYVILWV